VYAVWRARDADAAQPEFAAQLKVHDDAAVHWSMRCSVCEGSTFTVIDYRNSADGHCPALECLSCHAISLDESAANTNAERECVRLASIVRRQLCEHKMAS
jgi:hypothetical protein